MPVSAGSSEALRIVVQEPQFLPWCGFWHKAFEANVQVTAAGVKFDKYDHQQRVTIGGAWVGVPVKGGQRSGLIKDVRITDQYSNSVLLRKLMLTLAEAGPLTYMDRLQPLIVLLESVQFRFLLDLDFATTQCLANILGCKTEFTIDLDPREWMDKTQRLDDTIKTVAKGRKAIYLSGAGGRKYMDFDTLSYPVATVFQRPFPSTCPDSIVQLIAMEKDPVPYIKRCATWVSRFSDERGISW